MPAADGMVIRTNTPEVQKMRKGVMEFLLINHPLDCPICDQGGECDLQDQAMAYGLDHSRYLDNKRAVEEKNMGPLIKTFMTRCIHCTRCIRFAQDIAGVPELGAVGRGEHLEITTYMERAMTSELSGNVIDLCPVGALTSGPYAFGARSWELEKTESIDVLDAVGSNIRVDSRGPVVMRVLPRLNDDVNEEWISDKTRFAYDGLKSQRLDQPYVRRNGRLQPATWAEALAAVAERLKGLDGSKVAALAGNLVDCESMVALKDLMAGLGSPNLDCRQDGAKLDSTWRSAYLFNTTIAGIEDADACLIVGTNPRWEAPLINLRLRKRSVAGDFAVGVLGPEVDLTYDYQALGNEPGTLAAMATGDHPFAKVLKRATRPMLILGMGALTRPDSAAILAAARKIAEDTGMIREEEGWNGFNVLHTAAARVGGLDLGLVPGAGGRDTEAILQGATQGDIEAVYLLGADEIDMARLGGAFVVYQGHHGDAGATRADVILPGAAYTEKNATYVNTEGRVQLGRLAVFPPGEAREDWKILRALSEAMGAKLPYDSLDEVRARLTAVNPVFATIDTVAASPWGDFGTAGEVRSDPFVPPIDNFYMTDPISRVSETMAECTVTIMQATQGKTGTDG
jgi:NADH-quinone oxidoreductase subunit G